MTNIEFVIPLALRRLAEELQGPFFSAQTVVSNKFTCFATCQCIF